MTLPEADRLRRAAAWSLAAAVALVPAAIAAASPLQASRDALWIAGGLAGVLALSLLFLQPLLVGGLLPPFGAARQRRWHRRAGTAVVALVLLHVGGLYLTSPEDIADALLLVSPTPFALWGVIGLSGVVFTAGLAAARSRLGPAPFRILHTTLAAIVVASSALHAILIDGVMGETSKLVLCVCALAATSLVALKVALGRPLRERPRPSESARDA